MSFSIFSGITKHISSLLGGGKRSTEEEDDDKAGGNKKKRLKVNDVDLTALKSELDVVQQSVSTQIGQIAQKYKGIEESGKKHEEENRNLKDLLYQRSLEAASEKNKADVLRDANSHLMDILKETEKNIEDSIKAPAQLLEATRNKIRNAMQNTVGKSTKELKPDVTFSSEPLSTTFTPSSGANPSSVVEVKNLEENTLPQASEIGPGTGTSSNTSSKSAVESSPEPSVPHSSSSVEKVKSLPLEGLEEDTKDPLKKQLYDTMNSYVDATSSSLDLPSDSVKPSSDNTNKNNVPDKTSTSTTSTTPTTNLPKSGDTPKDTEAISGTETPKVDASPTATATEVKKEEKPKNPSIVDINPDLSFSDIRGLDEQIKSLRQSILFPVANKDKLVEYGVVPIKGVVFHGDSAASDMLEVAKALTSELGRVVGKNFTFVQRFKPDTCTRYSSDGEKMVKKFFDDALASVPAVIFLEDIHTLYHYCDILGSAFQLVAAVSEGMGRITPGDVLVIATTDSIKKLAPRLNGRGCFEKQISFNASTEQRRKESLERHTSKWTLKPTEEILETIAKKAETVECNDLEQLCREAFLAALHRKFTTPEKDPCQRCASLNEGDKLKLNESCLESVEVLLEDWEVALATMTKQKEESKPGKKVEQTTSEAITIDPKLGFSSVGGLEEQIKILKENIMFPLANKESLSEWGVEPVKGIIFHGPPGTGKTLLAKALAAELSRRGEEPFSFFYRKGTDCFNMYIGETERNLRSLFAQAVAKKPSIIFFDEIDGLCAARSESSTASRFYNGVVTTMLGLLDGIKRGEVFVIAATNRLDTLDPALMRPGRFDKSVAFFPPKEEGRKAILGIQSSQWKRGKDDSTLEEISKQTTGYTGADLEQLCRQTFVCALRRQFPDLKEEDYNLKTGFDDFDILLEDWYKAKSTLKASSSRVFGNSVCTSKVIPPDVSKLVSGTTKEIIKKIKPFLKPRSNQPEGNGSGINSFLIYGQGISQSRIIENIILPNLLNSPEFKDTVTFTLDEDKMHHSKLKSVIDQLLTCDKAAILYIPRMDILEASLAATGASQHLFMEQIDSLRGENILLLASAGCPISELSQDFRQIFKGMPDSREYKMRKVEKEEIREFFSPILQNYPQMLDRVECLTTGANLYDILDLKAELQRVCGAEMEKELKAIMVREVLDGFEINRLDHCGALNPMYI